MPFAGWLFWGALLLLAVGALAYETVVIRRPPRGSVQAYLAESSTTQRGGAPEPRVVVCAGASIVNGTVSVDFVEMLRQRFPPDAWRFLNAGVSGEMAWQLRRRLDQIVQTQPDDIYILIGSNDVQAHLNPRIRQMVMERAGVPDEPTPHFYADNMRAIVERLQQQTTARVTLLSLPPIGEDLASPTNVAACAYNEAQRQVAQETGADWIDLFTPMADALRSAGAGDRNPYTTSPVEVMEVGFRHLVLGQSLDAISAKKGYILLTDRIHLNSRAAGMVTDAIAAHLVAQPSL